jgi:hypothetical protein
MLIMTINHIPRKQFLKWSFIWLAVLFAITGGSLFTVFHTNIHSVTMYWLYFVIFLSTLVILHYPYPLLNLCIQTR